MCKVLVGIVTFNPNQKGFSTSLASIKKINNDILIVDNFSSNFDEIAPIIKKNNCKIIQNDKNLGIATALNQICNYALKNKFDRVLTFDQDSIAEENLILEYKKYINLPKVGLLTCNIIDKETGLHIDKFVNEVTLISKCITSGSLVSINAYAKSDKFDDWMFIDCVDYDFCKNLIKHGFNIYQIPYIGVKHKIGETKIRYFFLKKITILNEKPFRHYYIARNTYYCSRKYKMRCYRLKEFIFELLERLKVLLYEKQKILKLKNRIKGIKDAKKAIKNGILKYLD